jgi:hypothetical protein
VVTPDGFWWDGGHANLRIIGRFEDPATGEQVKFQLTTLLKDGAIWQATVQFAPLGWNNLHLK